jgi:hypothetical protein
MFSSVWYRRKLKGRKMGKGGIFQSGWRENQEGKSILKRKLPFYPLY